MQTVAAAFTAEERDETRSPVGGLQVSWKKFSTLSNRTFTIGVSTIGGNDIIGINPGAIGSPGNYKYFDESDYLLSLAWERGLNMPTGGLTKGLAEAMLENTTGRFTPRYMGGSSELYTAILPRRPFIINAGFNYAGIDNVIPQFAGVLTRQPQVNNRGKDLRLIGSDYIDFFQNRFLDQEVMFTGLRTDEVLERLFGGSLGMSTSQYDLDYGINIIPFGLFEKGTRFSNIIHELVEAEAGHLYQDETGIFKFENRQHWDSAPYTEVQRVLYTAQVIDSQAPDEDHLINVVEIRGKVRQKQPAQTVFTLPSLSFITVPGNSSVEKFLEFQDPILALTDPTDGGANSYFVANSESDETGTDITSNIQVRNLGTFAKSVKYRFTNTSSVPAFITQLVLSGRIAKTIQDIYYRAQDDSSVTAYEEQPYTLENEYIQDETWAQSYAQMILNDFSNVENLQRLTIRAIPELQLGDLISWQGRYWRVYNIRNILSPSEGYIQELTLLQRTILTYFRIGISTIGGSDRIAP